MRTAGLLAGVVDVHTVLCGELGFKRRCGNLANRARLIEIKHELEWRQAAKSPEFFFENFVSIRHPGKGMIPFKLRDAQKEGLAHWRKNRYSLTLKARQIGWSTLVANYALWCALFKKDQHIIMISRTEREAIALLAKTKYSYRHLPKWVRDRAPEDQANHQQKMDFNNESKIVSMPSASDPARGEAASLVIVDEWAFLPNAEEAWASIEPVADVGGRIIGLSTANGWGDFFHTMWVGARSGDNQFKAFFAPWSANTDRDDEWYEAKRRSTLPWILAREYPTTEEEAFVQSGQMVFDLDELKRLETYEPLMRGDFLDNSQTSTSAEFKPVTPAMGDEAITIWHSAETAHRYVVGADVAEGLEHGDFSSAHVIDVETGTVVATAHTHVPPDLFGAMLVRLGYMYNTALIGCESNNHGLSTITAMRSMSYPKIYRERKSLRAQGGGQPTGKFGWATTKVTKPLMIDELAEAIREGVLAIPDESSVMELKTYVRDNRGKLSGSPFDDRVISLAIANQMRKYAFNAEYENQNDIPPHSARWWLNMGTSLESDSWVIGQHSVRELITR